MDAVSIPNVQAIPSAPLGVDGATVFEAHVIDELWRNSGDCRERRNGGNGVLALDELLPYKGPNVNNGPLAGAHWDV